METDNKIRLAYGLKIAALAIWAMLTIITCAGVWNFNPEGFVKWAALALLICNGIVIYCFGKRLNKEFKANLQAYFDSLKK